MNNGSKSFEDIQNNNRIIIKRDFIQVIKKYQPEQAILIMGKHIPVEGKEKEYKYIMNITENVVPERIQNFINTLKAEIIRLENIKKQGLWKPPNRIIPT
jgi:hypothetical protein